MSAPISQEELFESEFRGPPGFIYRPAFITCEEESALLDIIRELPLQEAKFQQYTARRRTVRYGTEYDPRRRPMRYQAFQNFCFRCATGSRGGSNCLRKVSFTGW